jgi:hypothetical protein
VHPSESELYKLILGALPHSPWNPLPWLFSAILAGASYLAPWIRNQRPLARMMATLLLGGTAFAVMSHFSDRASERDAHTLARIVAKGNYSVFVVDEGEEVAFQGQDSSGRIYLGVSRAERISRILEKHGVSALSTESSVISKDADYRAAVAAGNACNGPMMLKHAQKWSTTIIFGHGDNYK